MDANLALPLNMNTRKNDPHKLKDNPRRVKTSFIGVGSHMFLEILLNDHDIMIIYLSASPLVKLVCFFRFGVPQDSEKYFSSHSFGVL